MQVIEVNRTGLTIAGSSSAARKYLVVPLCRNIEDDDLLELVSLIITHLLIALLYHFICLGRATLYRVKEDEGPLPLPLRYKPQNSLNVLFDCLAATLFLDGSKFRCKQQVELDVFAVVAD